MTARSGAGEFSPLRELHGVSQVTMLGWEGIHLYDFQLRAARYGSWGGGGGVTGLMTCWRRPAVP